MPGGGVAAVAGASSCGRRFRLDCYGDKWPAALLKHWPGQGFGQGHGCQGGIGLGRREAVGRIPLCQRPLIK